MQQPTEEERRQIIRDRTAKLYAAILKAATEFVEADAVWRSQPENMVLRGGAIFYLGALVGSSSRATEGPLDFEHLSRKDVEL